MELARLQALHEKMLNKSSLSNIVRLRSHHNSCLSKLSNNSMMLSHLKLKAPSLCPTSTNCHTLKTSRIVRSTSEWIKIIQAALQMTTRHSTSLWTIRTSWIRQRLAKATLFSHLTSIRCFWIDLRISQVSGSYPALLASVAMSSQWSCSETLSK